MAISSSLACQKGDAKKDRGTAIYHWPLGKVPCRPLSGQEYTTATNWKLSYIYIYIYERPRLFITSRTTCDK